MILFVATLKRIAAKEAEELPDTGLREADAHVLDQVSVPVADHDGLPHRRGDFGDGSRSRRDHADRGGIHVGEYE